MDLKMSNSGDLDVTNGALSFVQDSDAIAQQIAISLRLFKGEWFLAPLEGVPYFDKVLIKAPSTASLAAVFRDALLDVPGVLEVIELAVAFDAAARKVSLSFQVKVSGSDVPLTFDEFVV